MSSSSSSSSSSSTTPQPSSPLQFQAFQSSIAVSFWSWLNALKLDTLRLRDDAVPMLGSYANGTHVKVPSLLCLAEYSLSGASATGASAAAAAAPPAGFPADSCAVFGTLHNFNTLQQFQHADVNALGSALRDDMWSAIVSDRALAHPERELNRVLLLTFADLKSHKYHYWACLPALVHPHLSVTAAQPPALLREHWPAEHIASMHRSYAAFASAAQSTGVPAYFVLRRSPRATAPVTCHPLLEYAALCRELASDEELLLGFVDPCPLSTNPGWPLRTLLLLAAVSWQVEGVRVVAFRDVSVARAAASQIANAPSSSSSSSSLLLDVRLERISGGATATTSTLTAAPPKIVGWEKNQQGKLGPRVVDLGALMDPVRLAETSVDLNLKLMRWRALPNLDLSVVSSSRCLLFGAGTLGCNVARALLGWGVRHITFVDYGKVSFSNPVRQSLFTFNDCINGGKAKAEAAAESVRSIFPSVASAGHSLTVPMPGHAVSASELTSVRRDVATIARLIDEHDAVFLLMDSRESRWLPTVMCAATNKLCLNAALGFDTYLVMRHGVRDHPVASAHSDAASSAPAPAPTPPNSTAQPHALGCYFCTDVVAPTNSQRDRTLDQQCTVTRPGVAYMSSALLVELFVSLLQHPLRHRAPSELDGAYDNAGLGYLPHQMRGFLKHFNTVLLSGHASPLCTACSRPIVEAYRARGVDFVLDVINAPSSSAYLEELSGWAAMQRDMDARLHAMKLDGDDDEGDDDEGDDDEGDLASDQDDF